MSPEAKRGHSDIAAGDWVDRFLPAGLRPYARLARLDRPIGTWLLLWPCLWGLALGTERGLPAWGLIGLFTLGAVVMRGAGCVVNDLADRDFDRKVERTASRPIASGAISVRQALGFMALLGGIGLAVLLQFEDDAIWLGLASLPLVAIYPFMKRITHWPQFVLGLAFNWGALLGFMVAAGRLDWPAFMLYAGGIFWTLGYDTIYAHQDKADDAIVGVRSTALLFGRRTRRWIYVFYALALSCFAAAATMANLSWAFWAELAVAAAHLFWQAWRVDFDDPADCLDKFRSNRDFGLLLFLGLVLGQVLPL
ncbi:MAG: 4-hydroxybenzoate octaprenyltransferase [Alphaproteobacteria bacterium]|nr:4-hydroxybenzoate octaprenyltransferase [Alphaproteobacteria bacterium]